MTRREEASGMPILECPEAAKDIGDGDRISVNIMTGTIINATKGKAYQAEPFPPFMMELMAVGGLINYVRIKMKK